MLSLILIIQYLVLIYCFHSVTVVQNLAGSVPLAVTWSGEHSQAWQTNHVASIDVVLGPTGASWTSASYSAVLGAGVQHIFQIRLALGFICGTSCNYKHRFHYYA